jgi:hypothetical protein
VAPARLTTFAPRPVVDALHAGGRQSPWRDVGGVPVMDG